MTIVIIVVTNGLTGEDYLLFGMWKVKMNDKDDHESCDGDVGVGDVDACDDKDDHDSCEGATEGEDDSDIIWYTEYDDDDCGYDDGNVDGDDHDSCDGEGEDDTDGTRDIKYDSDNWGYDEGSDDRDDHESCDGATEGVDGSEGIERTERDNDDCAYEDDNDDGDDQESCDGFGDEVYNLEVIFESDDDDAVYNNGEDNREGSIVCNDKEEDGVGIDGNDSGEVNIENISEGEIGEEEDGKVQREGEIDNDDGKYDSIEYEAVIDFGMGILALMINILFLKILGNKKIFGMSLKAVEMMIEAELLLKKLGFAVNYAYGKKLKVLMVGIGGNSGVVSIKTEEYKYLRDCDILEDIWEDFNSEEVSDCNNGVFENKNSGNFETFDERGDGFDKIDEDGKCGKGSKDCEDCKGDEVDKHGETRKCGKVGKFGKVVERLERDDLKDNWVECGNCGNSVELIVIIGLIVVIGFVEIIVLIEWSLKIGLVIEGIGLADLLVAIEAFDLVEPIVLFVVIVLVEPIVLFEVSMLVEIIEIIGLIVVIMIEMIEVIVVIVLVEPIDLVLVGKGDEVFNRNDVCGFGGKSDGVSNDMSDSKVCGSSGERCFLKVGKCDECVNCAECNGIFEGVVCRVCKGTYRKLDLYCGKRGGHCSKCEGFDGKCGCNGNRGKIGRFVTCGELDGRCDSGSCDNCNDFPETFGECD
ncbi:hypothetical protein CWI38_0342p0030 [Hamiltosporidium tvaerminnensis]|uniref:Uncharacterized protein n=1 Tax=Hamiltosporidium tvaerminnensis TaxID=1176355 RepID=A0A4Q9LZL4_9MICR|nr:hypothetical protein CWI38_0342p0030 [Hamiltosporidium tvaerminnensis]